MRKSILKKTSDSFLTREDLETYLKENPHHSSARQIAKAFGLKNAQARMMLQALLKELKSSSGRHRRASLPKKKKLEQDARKKNTIVLGIVQESDHGLFVSPTSRQDRQDYRVSEEDALKLTSGDLVEISPCVPSLPSSYGARVRQPSAKLVRILGSMNDPRSISLIAVHTYQLPFTFSQEALALASQATLPLLGDRQDLRHIPLVTIDDEDARDFDDAVWASPDSDADNPGGWQLIVAIADVSAYVRPGDALDQEAFLRGNSIYFPDSVIPMLPEALSNGLCSLKPNEDRACLAVHVKIDGRGCLKSHHFMRGLMRSAERLTYRETQEAFEGRKTRLSSKFVDTVIKPLYEAYHVLTKARAKRSPLDLDLPEERIELDEKGKISKIMPRVRLESHRLIEEFMITANVAAAITLNEKKSLCLYRVHDRPNPEKLETLRHFLKSLSLDFAKGQVIFPRVFNMLIQKTRDKLYAQTIQDSILKTQAQALYDPDNVGHFGLNLARYVHFTSPIRRYADLLIHRALGHVLDLSDADAFSYSREDFHQISTHINITERRAASAERDTIARYISAYLSPSKGEMFLGRIVHVTDFALFVRLEESGAEGMILLRTLEGDYFVHDPQRHQVVGRRTKKVYALGDLMKVILVEVDVFKGSLRFIPVVEKPEKTRKRETTLKQSRKKTKRKRRE